MVPVISELWKYRGHDKDLKEKGKKEEHRPLCTAGMFSLSHWEEAEVGQVGVGSARTAGAERLSNLYIVWGENAEPGARDRTKSGCRLCIPPRPQLLPAPAPRGLGFVPVFC